MRLFFLKLLYSFFVILELPFEIVKGLLYQAMVREMWRGIDSIGGIEEVKKMVAAINKVQVEEAPSNCKCATIPTKSPRRKAIAKCCHCGGKIYSIEEGCEKCNKEMDK